MADDVKNSLNAKLENAKVLDHTEVRPGVHSMDLQVGEKGLPVKELAYLTGENGEASPLRFHEGGRSVIYRDWLRRVDLDLAETSVSKEKHDRLYSRAIEYYRTKGAYGTVIDTLTNFSSKGFKNDIDDPEIKLFFDTWTDEIGFQKVVENIFFDFFRVGMVRTFKMVGKFEPRLKPSSLVPRASYSSKDYLHRKAHYREFAAAKKVWSKSYVPLRYTVLNPTLILIQGSLMFDNTEVYLKPEAFADVKKMLEHTSEGTKEQRKILDELPKEMIQQIKTNKPVRLPPELVGKCDYRKQDYERYPMPRIVRAFDALDYKHELQKADYSTLDGITNYILKITIGSDEHPVTDQAQLETVARLFDTTSKSFDIVWNHTLKVEKITFPEISDILGQDKFKQVNDDLSMSFGLPRALIDGEGGSNSKAVEIGSKAFTEEINYARRCVMEWIYNEYEEVALALGFDRYPTVRFDDMALKDEIMMMSIVQGMMDRRVISYRTGIEKLGFDYETELANMQAEKPLVQSGDIGIIGSPYNPKAAPAQQEPEKKEYTPEGRFIVLKKEDLDEFLKNKPVDANPNVQPSQRTPKGTPSEGRPRKGGGKRRQPSTKPKPPQPTKS